MKISMMMVLMLSTSITYANRESGERYAAATVFVDFLSIGTGIDLPSLNLSETLIDESEKDGNILDRRSVQQGREGETFLCVEFSDVAERVSFIKAIAPSILKDRQKGYSRTVVLVGVSCDDKAGATEQDIRAY